jgi:hypothetical protein
LDLFCPFCAKTVSLSAGSQKNVVATSIAKTTILLFKIFSPLPKKGSRVCYCTARAVDVTNSVPAKPAPVFFQNAPF